MKGILKLLLALVLLSVAPLSQAVIYYVQELQGAAESPPNASPGNGFVTVAYDSTAHTLLISAIWADLIGTTTVAHIHCCTAVPETGLAGVAVTPGTLPGFPVGTTAGSYTSPLLDLNAASTFTASFVTNFAGGVLADAEEALIAGFDAHRAYFNIHSNVFPAGEIRGFLVLAVPEPLTLGLFGLGLAAMGLSRRKKA